MNVYRVTRADTGQSFILQAPSLGWAIALPALALDAARGEGERVDGDAAEAARELARPFGKLGHRV